MIYTQTCDIVPYFNLFFACSFFDNFHCCLISGNTGHLGRHFWVIPLRRSIGILKKVEKVKVCICPLKRSPFVKRSKKPLSRISKTVNRVIISSSVTYVRLKRFWLFTQDDNILFSNAHKTKTIDWTQFKNGSKCTDEFLLFQS